MAKVTVKVGKRNPSDATGRNIRAAHKRERALLKRVERLEAKVGRLGFYIRALGRSLR